MNPRQLTALLALFGSILLGLVSYWATNVSAQILSQEHRITVLEAHYDAIQDSLKRIEAKLEKMDKTPEK